MNSIFDLDEFKQYSRRWHARQQELTRRKGYYDGSAYGKLRDKMGWLWPRLYQGIKPLYLTLSTAVDIDAGLIPGEWAWEEDAPEMWDVARQQIFDWSDWRRRGVLYVHYGALFGSVGLRVADLRDRGQVQIIPSSPEYFMLVEEGQYDMTPSLAFWLEQREGEDGPVEYAEVITADEIRTFWDGKPMGIEGRPDRYPNELGFVPFVETRHKETGDPLGECTYQLTIPMLDELNQVASYLGDVINKNQEPQWVVSGAESSELTRSGDNVWFLPNPQAKAMPLVPNLDIGGVIEFIDRIDTNVRRALPESAYDDLKEKTQIATATLELQLGALVVKIKRCRPNYDQGLIDALRMCARSAATMGIREIAMLDDDALTFDEERPVLPLDELTKIQIEQAQLGLEMQKSLAGGDGMTALTRNTSGQLVEEDTVEDANPPRTSPR